MQIDKMNTITRKDVHSMTKRTQKDGVPNVSGSFQVSSEKQQDDLKQVEKENKLDEESMHYARLFMED